jgi:hypothetical protein
LENIVLNGSGGCDVEERDWRQEVHDFELKKSRNRLICNDTERIVFGDLR